MNRELERRFPRFNRPGANGEAVKELSPSRPINPLFAPSASRDAAGSRGTEAKKDGATGDTMKPRQFLARDMTEALRAVRQSLGPDALILKSRSVDGAGVEVIAMNEEAEEIRAPAPIAAPMAPAGPLDEVRQEIAEVRALLGWLLPSISGKGMVEKLLDQGLAPDVITRVAREMEKSAHKDERERMFAALARLIPCAAELERAEEKRGCAALIGPTGVGKTTTLIKLTVRLAGQRQRRLGWIALESRRAVGGDLLASYCGILGVAYRAAHDRETLTRAFEELSDCDWVLVDTPGANPRDAETIEELGAALAALPDLHRILCLGATTNARDLADWLGPYAALGFDSLAFTKLDECRYFGPLINTAINSGRPLSYVTVGQDLVNDLQPGRAEMLASLLLSGWSNDD